jgi:hypothetical protein
MNYNATLLINLRIAQGIYSINTAVNNFSRRFRVSVTDVSVSDTLKLIQNQEKFARDKNRSVLRETRITLFLYYNHRQQSCSTLTPVSICYEHVRINCLLNAIGRNWQIKHCHFILPNWNVVQIRIVKNLEYD